MSAAGGDWIGVTVFMLVIVIGLILLSVLIIQAMSAVKKTILLLPGTAGLLLHWPLYIFLKKMSLKRTFLEGHFDSIMVGLLIAIYPFYLLLWALALYLFFGGYWGVALFIVLPFFAWCYLQIKQQIDK